MVRHGCLNLIDCFVVPELVINCLAVSGMDGVALWSACRAVLVVP